ncbi:MAG: hypothetical protein HQL95_02335 [Magnetococcales bacterium]|nr:hypothetical protein [Magnetococcales bacterium]
MRNFTYYLAQQLSRTDGAGFRPVVVIEARQAGGSPVIRTLSTAATVGQNTGLDPTLLSVSSIDEAPGRLGDVTVEVVETAQNRAVIRPLQLVSIYLVPTAAEADTIDPQNVLFKGTISSPIVRANGRIRFDVVSWANEHNKKIYHPILASDFPKIDPSLIGKSMPVIYGTIKNVPLFLENSPRKTRLASAITATDTTIILRDALPLIASFEIYIEDELVIIREVSDKTLKDCQRRNTSGIYPSDHVAGAIVTECELRPRFLAGNGPFKNVTDISIDGVLTDGLFYTEINNITSDLTFNWSAGMKAPNEWNVTATVSGKFSTGLFFLDKDMIYNALLEQPDHIVRHLLRLYGGATLYEIDGDPWDRNGGFDDFTGITLGIYLPEPTTVFEVLGEIGRQCNAIITFSGDRWIMRKYPSPQSTPVATLTEADILRNEGGSSTLSISSADLGAIYNKVSLRAGAIPDGSWTVVKTCDFPDHQELFGVREGSLDLPFFHNETQADAQVAELVRRNSGLTEEVSFSTTLAHLALEIGDFVRINHAPTNTDLSGQVIARRYSLTGSEFGAIQMTIRTVV